MRTFALILIPLFLAACVTDSSSPWVPTPHEIDRFGTEGRLMDLNAEVSLSLPNRADCTAHVAAVERALARELPGVKAEKLYSCPNGGLETGLCHVSVLVTDGKGERLVVDNGAVLRNYPQQVARLDDFSYEVSHTYWIGKPPQSQEAIDIQAFFDQLNF